MYLASSQTVYMSRSVITSTSPPAMDLMHFRSRSTKDTSQHDIFIDEHTTDIDNFSRSSGESPTKNVKAQETKTSKQVQTTKVTNFPVPTPDDGIQPTITQVSSYSRTTLQLVFSTPSATPVTLDIPGPYDPPPFSATISPTTLNLLPTAISTTSSTSISLLAPHTAALSPSPSSNFSQHASASHQLPVAIVVVLAIGCAILFAGVFFILKACSRPTRQARPKPSLPILDDAYSDDDLYKSKESPIFGGKERISSQPGAESKPWTWTQYPVATASPVSPLPLPCVSVSSGDAGSKQDGNPSQGQRTLNSSPSPLRNSLQLGHKMSNRPRSRSSTAKSLSIYPTSPLSIPGETANNGKIFTADGHSVIRRDSRAAIRRSRSNIMDEAGSRSSFLDTNFQELAYDGAAVQSPQFLAHFQVAPPSATPRAGGRSRIKSSYYTPGSYPRISALPSSTKIKVNDVTEAFNIQELPSIHRTNSCKDRELTSALGLASTPMETIPLSPQPTIYPDDSLSVVDTRSPKRRQSKKLPTPSRNEDDSQRITMSPTMDTSTALGSLMLMDFGTTSKSLATLAGRLGENIESSSTGSKLSKITSDKPPRVPSPPPLPSLAQMGLQHANPEAYADYRSPTYSIFGLYGEDRRSRISLHSRTE